MECGINFVWIMEKSFTCTCLYMQERLSEYRHNQQREPYLKTQSTRVMLTICKPSTYITPVVKSNQVYLLRSRKEGRTEEGRRKEGQKGGKKEDRGRTEGRKEGKKEQSIEYIHFLPSYTSIPLYNE